MAIKILCDYCDLEITGEKEVGTLSHFREKMVFIPKSHDQSLVREKTDTHLCFRCLDKIFKALKK